MPTRHVRYKANQPLAPTGIDDQSIVQRSAVRSFGANGTQPHKEAVVAKSIRWRKRNPEWVKAYDKTLYERNKDKVFAYYGSKCRSCGETTREFLTIDHINNDGAEHRRQGVTTIYRWLVANDFPEGFQILCWNCNAAKQ